jgi:subtilase family serine protease
MRLSRPLLIGLGSLALLLSNHVAVQAQPPNPLPGQAANHVPVCPGAADPGAARCHAERRTDAVGTPAQQPVARPNVVGNGGAYDPSFLRSAYQLPALSAGSGATVAIVDAYDDPKAASDLAYYRSYFGLPACTTANGCFKKVNQTGGTRYPRSNSGWAQEIALDLEMVSAICPNCHILLVEASSSAFTNLGTAVNYAAKQRGVVAISNSYGGGEFSGETADDASYYSHPGIAVTASSGDGGYGVEYPAASPAVTAVGGTSLTQNANSGVRDGSETVWNGAGSGCSVYEAKPSWQTDSGCGKRTVADVAAVADPNTGVWVYYNGGWYIFGGTSVASPIVASVYALAGNTAALTGGAYSYGHTTALNDVTAGSNGSCGNYLCTGTSGYDGPTGNGTPNGTGGF